MKRVGKLFSFIAVSLFFLVFGSAVQLCCWIFRLPSGHVLAQLSSTWSRTLLSVLGITVNVNRPQNVPEEHGSLIVANHQSYLDIIVVGSVFPTLFVAKKQVRTWPVLGWLAMVGGTVFIDRNAFRGAVQASSEMERALTNAANVLVFPEGTSTKGNVVLPFRSFLFSAAVSSVRPVQPITILYEMVDGQHIDGTNSDSVCWYGEMTFLHHFWQLLSRQSVKVSLVIHPPIRTSTTQSARVLSELAHFKVCSSFQPIL